MLPRNTAPADLTDQILGTGMEECGEGQPDSVEILPSQRINPGAGLGAGRDMALRYGWFQTLGDFHMHRYPRIAAWFYNQG